MVSIFETLTPKEYEKALKYKGVRTWKHVLIGLSEEESLNDMEQVKARRKDSMKLIRERNLAFKKRKAEGKKIVEPKQAENSWIKRKISSE